MCAAGHASSRAWCAHCLRGVMSEIADRSRELAEHRAKWSAYARAGDIAHAHVAPAVDLVVAEALDERLPARAREALPRRKFTVGINAPAWLERVDVHHERGVAKVRVRYDAAEFIDLPIAIPNAWRLMDAMSGARAAVPRVRLVLEVEE